MAWLDGLARKVAFLPDMSGRTWILLFVLTSVLFGILVPLVLWLKASLTRSTVEKLAGAEDLARAGKFGEARAAFLAAGALGRAADMAYRQGDPEEARRLAEEGRHFELAGLILSSRGEHRAAAEAFDAARKPQAAADQWERAGDLETALARYRTIGHVRKEQAILTQLGRFCELGESFERELEKLRRIMGEQPSAKQAQNASELAERVAEAYARGSDFARAHDVALRAGLTLRAAGYMERLGQPRRAADLYRQAGRLEEAGRVLTAAGEFDAAVELYDEMDRPREIPRVLEMAGRIREARVYEARLAIQDGDLSKGAGLLEAAGEYREAAEQYALIGESLKAGELFLRADLPLEAAASFEAAGDPAKAAAAFEKASRFEAAGKNREKAGDPAKARIDYGRAGAFFDVGRLDEAAGDDPKAIAAYQKVAPASPRRVAAAHALGRLFWKKGVPSLAEQHFGAALKNLKLARETLPLFHDYACFLEGTGRLSEAGPLFEKILSVDFHFKDALARKKGIEERIRSASSPAAGRNARTTVSDGTLLAGRYELGEVIGKGGMGVVYAGQDRKLGRPVALKLLPPSILTGAEDESRLMEEARMAARLSHANIVALYDIGKANEGLFLVMERVEGTDLKETLEKSGPLGISRAIHIARQIAEGLGYAHARQVVHRDVKSANILLGPRDQVKIADFGLARVLKNPKLTATRAIGSPLYMAPEQILGGTYDARVDLYSLGVVLYEMLTGTPPFTAGEVAYHHRHTPVPSPRTFRRDLPEAIEAILLKLLAKQPDARFATSEAFLKELDAVSI